MIIGQRKGFSPKDITKLQHMYREECKARDEKEKNSESFADALDLLFP